MTRQTRTGTVHCRKPLQRYKLISPSIILVIWRFYRGMFMFDPGFFDSYIESERSSFAHIPASEKKFFFSIEKNQVCRYLWLNMP